MVTKEIKANPSDNKYDNKAIRFLDKGDHYELIFTDFFDIPSDGLFGEKPYTVITDVIIDMKEADKSKELHIFVGSFGGAAHCLNMLIQQITQFKHVVGINLGYACSCGFMVLMFCNEIYTTEYATFLYHDMSGVAFGKITENKNTITWQEKWWNILKEKSNVDRFLTPEELKLGETSEVWLTGKDLIDRGLVNPYEYYTVRVVPKSLDNEFYQINDEIYRKEQGRFVKYIKSNSKNNSLTYCGFIRKTMEKIQVNR